MSVVSRRDVFQAIADPTRRQIISLIAGRPRNLNAIAENFDISRSAVSQQIKILSECGLIIITRKGRERYCEASLETLGDVADWVEQYRQFWEGRLGKLDMLLKDLQKEKRSITKKGRK
jgi:DNA-binding transcriptional ArsR family regulator